MITVYTYQNAAFPLKWIVKFNLNDQAMLLILTSQGISHDLAHTVIAHSTNIETEDICSILKASGNHVIFVEWLMDQFQRTRDELRHYLEIDFNKASNGIGFIANNLETAVETLSNDKS